ncbi:MAG TPA: DUF58 domain-containing protein [Blastocatellia bacterium]|nr:DUF58 domain-containing protein [Blastocatellia bacterium]
MNRGAWRDFFITVFFLGIAFVIALLSSVAAEQNASLHAAIAAAISLVLALIGALYIIPRLARNVRMEILRFAVRTTVTVEGLLFIVFLMVIAFAAWNTGNNLLYLVLSAMMAFLVAANLIARLSLGDVAVQLRFPDHIFAGEPASLNVTLLNHKKVMPSYSLMVEALSDNEQDAEAQKKEGDRDEKRKLDSSNKKARAGVSESPNSGAAIDAPALSIGKLAYYVLAPARASVRQRVLYTFERRGRYPITGFRISTKFPASFFKKWRRIDASGEIVVYPKPQPLDDFYHALPMMAGQIQSQARGWGDDLYAIRRYHPSDHMRHIDWKATAKSSQMMVREHVREDEWRLTIVFDTARPQDAEPAAQKKEAAHKAENKSEQSADEHEQPKSFEERFERAVVMAASLANHFILESADVELITADERHNVDSGNGYEHLYKILRSLATLQPTLPADSRPSAAKGKIRSLFKRAPKPKDEKREGAIEAEQARKIDDRMAWRLLDEVPVLADERRFKVLITSAAKRTIPANIWRSAHVVFMEDL